MRIAQQSVTICGIVTVAACLPITVVAQQNTSETLEEIIVTAQKREQRLQDVPLSVSVLDEAVIQDARVADMRDLVLLTPGLDVAESIGRQTAAPSIRGIAPLGFGDPTVIVFTDGFTLGFTRDSNNAQLLGLERVEILKGPQATLYGRNALGGVINYITKKPSNESDGYVSASYGTYESYDVAAAMSGAVVEDKLYAGVAVGGRGTGGFKDNRFTGEKDVDDERDRSARASVRATPTENLELNFSASFSESDDACGDCAHVPSAYNSADPARLRNIGAGLLDFNDIDRTVNMDTLGGFTREDQTYVLNAEYSLNSVTVTSITGFGRAETEIIGDTNRQPGPSPANPFFIVPIESEGWSEELRFASNGSGRLTWLGGLYAFGSSRHGRTIQNGTTVSADSTTETTNYAGFSSIEFALTDVVSFGAGLRYDYEKTEFTNHLNPTAPTRELDFSEWLPRATVSYRPTEQLHIYGTVARGYHAGGFNSATAPEPTFGSEYVWNYEVGLKGGFFHNRLQPQLAVYYIDWDDQQISERFGPAPADTFVANTGAARIYGVDAGVVMLPAQGLQVTAAVSFADTKYTHLIDNIFAPQFGVDTNLNGNRLPFAPRWSGSASVQYLLPLSSSGWRARLRADARYMGDRAFDRLNLLIADSYWLANVYAGVQNDHYEVGFYADNLFDEEYLVGGFNATSQTAPLLSVSDPRTYGVRVKVSF